MTIMSQQYKVRIPRFTLCFELWRVCVNKLCLYYHYLLCEFLCKVMALMVELSPTVLDSSVLL